MADKITMPQLGESIAEGTIVNWLKKPGDAVEKDENVVIISTDKVEAEIPAPATGVLLDILVGPGETVDVGTVLGHVGNAGEATSAPAKDPEPATAPEPKIEATPAPPIPAAAPVSAPLSAPLNPPPLPPATGSRIESGITGNSGFYSPLVKKIAKENQIPEMELDTLSGSGQNSRVTKKDILAYVQNRPAGQAFAPLSGMSHPVTQAPKPHVPNHGIVFPSGAPEVAQPVSTMRRVIMENMVRSRQTSAHVTTFFEIDYTNVDKVRTKDKATFLAEEGVPLTYTTFLAASLAQCLRRHPYINAEIRDGQVIFKKDVHLGVAVSIEKPEPGLMVPVIKNADKMNLRGIAHAIKDLGDRTRNRRIKPDELSGGTFTITNPGNYGAIIGTPIINQPQVAILGVGKIAKQAVAMEVNGTDVVGVKRMGWLSLSFDHRLVDGATADIFMADVKHTLENWTNRP